MGNCLEEKQKKRQSWWQTEAAARHPFFLNNTRTKWRKIQIQFATKQEQNEEFPSTQEQNEEKAQFFWRSNNTRTKWRKRQIITKLHNTENKQGQHTDKNIHQGASFSTIYFMDITIPPFEDSFEFSKWILMLESKIEICQKIYTTGFSGQKFYTLKETAYMH